MNPWTVGHQAPLSMEFSRQEYWRGQSFPSPGVFPGSGIEPGSLALQAGSLPSEPPRNTHTHTYTHMYIVVVHIYIYVCVCVCVWPKYWGFSFSISPSNEYSGLISFRIDRFDLLAVQETLRIFSRLLVQDGGGERCISSPPNRTAKLRMAVSSNQQKDTETHQKTDSPCPEIKIKL